MNGPFDGDSGRPDRSDPITRDRLIGPFRLIRELGRGGMGIVYLAHDTSLDRRLALKVLPHSVSNEPKVVQRFLREAQAAARLRHANIIPIFSAGEVEGTYYYSMEYVPGVSLARVLKSLREKKLGNRGVLTVRRVLVDGHPELRLANKSPLLAAAEEDGRVLISFDQRNYVHEALRLFADVADALHYAHEHGVVHRDVKPSNLLLAPDGRLMVADFGLAKIGDARSITKTGDLLGSPSYMSPEQTMTKRVPIDRRTDVWSLGVSLYELLTLKHPFEAKSLEVSLRNIVSNEPVPPRRVNPRLPKDVETILLKTLEKNPSNRYATAADLSADIRCVLNYESIQAKTTGPITRSFRFVRRNRSQVAFGVLLLALGAVLLRVFDLQQETKLHDFDRGRTYFRGVMDSESEGQIDPRLVQEIEDELLHRHRDAENLAQVLDEMALDVTHEAEALLPSEDGPGDLAAAMGALRKIRLIHMHNPDAVQRERVEKLDRATADIRVRLVWALFDSLVLDGTSMTDPSGEPRWRWLIHFLGTTDWTDGIPRERNPLVRKNAIDALCRLGESPAFTDATKEALCRVVADVDAEDDVRAEAIKALSSSRSSRTDVDVLGLFASLTQSDSYFELPALSRYSAAKILAESPRAFEYDSVFRQLQKDPARAVEQIATSALARLDRE